ncbi:MAG TPA: rhodanese-like domain-containing protein [Pyrinomonadaceae bacterium]|nr:rhodanese-like domain-containing protein [Pyrinomonadaceae bacterium]
MTPKEEPKRVSVEEARRMIADGRAPVFIDTRNPKHWEQSAHQIPGSLRIWRIELEERIDEVPRGRPLVTYCACHYEHSSTRAALILEEYDFEEIHILVGGFNAWRDAGLPLEAKQPASGAQPSAETV